jgi:hypothetical protein
MNARTVPVLRCFAGDLPLGLAAEEVLEFRPVERELPHIATLLGVPPGPEDAAQRTLSLACGDDLILINVDGPVKIRTLGPSEILVLPGFFAHGGIAPVLGFAEEDGRVVLLLDVPSVSRIVRRAAAAQSPAASSTPSLAQGKQTC